MIAYALIALLAAFIASVTLAVHHGRQHPPGTHREPGPEAERRSMEKLRGHVAARVSDNARPLGAPPAPRETLVLPCTRQAVPHARTAGRPPWPVQPTLTEGGRPWRPPVPTATEPASSGPTRTSAPAEATASRTSSMSGTAAPSRALVAAPSSRRIVTDEPVWTPGRIRVCEHPGCPARQSHATEGHDRWLGMVSLLARPVVAEPAADFRLPAWDPPPVGLPAYAEAALGAASVTGAIRQIFPEAVKSDA